MRAVLRCPEDCCDIMDVRALWDAIHDGRAYALVSNLWLILMMITTLDRMLHGTLTLTNVSEHVVHRSSDGMEMTRGDGSHVVDLIRACRVCDCGVAYVHVSMAPPAHLVLIWT